MKCHYNYLFEIKHLLSNKQEKSNGRRLKVFHNENVEITGWIKNDIASHQNELLVLECFEVIRRYQSNIEVLEKWKGFDLTENDWVTTEMILGRCPRTPQWLHKWTQIYWNIERKIPCKINQNLIMHEIKWLVTVFALISCVLKPLITFIRLNQTVDTYEYP